MKTQVVLVLLLASFGCTTGFMTLINFLEGNLTECYRDLGDLMHLRTQVQRLPNSIETFTSLVERYESMNPSVSTVDVIKKLLMSFRIDGLGPQFRVWEPFAKDINDLLKAFFRIPDKVHYEFKENDFAAHEQCALHFMLSHTINQTMGPNDEYVSEQDKNLAKHPKELGVVSVHAKPKHAVALGRVLLGILAGLSLKKEMDISEISQKLPFTPDDLLGRVKINTVYAVTFADLVSIYLYKYYDGTDPIFQPNGVWKDTTCTTEYVLDNNYKRYMSNSVLRGAVDGLILGKTIMEKEQIYKQFKLSQILRMYYGATGLSEDSSSKSGSNIRWCERATILNNILNNDNSNEILQNYNKLFYSFKGAVAFDSATREIESIVSFIKSSDDIFRQMSDEASNDCTSRDSSFDGKCDTPYDIFPILQWGSGPQLDFQIEVLGRLSTSFDIRPKGSSVGAYSNIKEFQGNALNCIANNTGISGCASCFARYYNKSPGQRNEIEVFTALNETLTDFENTYELTRNSADEAKTGVPAKVVLYFNYATNVANDYKLREAVREIEHSFREVTVLAIGSRKESLEVFTDDDSRNIFTEATTTNAEALVTKLKKRICKVPAEFQFKECGDSSSGEKRQYIYIPEAKTQYWVMYPKYFLKSFKIKMTFRPQNGGEITVCFFRYYSMLFEERINCRDCCKKSSEGEITFEERNPCHRYNEHNCKPFYFFIEGVKAPNNLCESLRCKTPKDIQVEFQHEGISCSTASFISVSSLALLISALVLYMHRH